MPATVPTPPPPRPSKTLDFAIAVAAIAWFFTARELAARSASGISQRLDLLAVGSVLRPLFLLFLLVLGFQALEFVARRRSSVRDLLGLPTRPTARHEWAVGAAIGWATLLLAVAPIALFGSFHVQLWTEPRAFLYTMASLLSAALSALALEITFRGFAFRRLIDAIGTTLATLVLSIIFGLLSAFSPGATGTGFLVSAVLGVLLSIGWLRTHALWLSWGLNFAWITSMGILFGLPVAGSTDLSSIVQSFAAGRQSLTGGIFGPQAAPFTLIAVLLAIPPMFRLTRDLAWNYTHRLIVAAGYPMDVPPPAAHTAVAATVSPAPPPLVQILPSTPQQRSVTDPPR